VHVYDVFLKYHEKIVIDQYISCSEWSCLDDKMMMYCHGGGGGVPTWKRRGVAGPHGEGGADHHAD
jgi:hypothetical protein